MSKKKIVRQFIFVSLFSMLVATTAIASPTIDAAGALKVKSMVDETLLAYTQAAQAMEEGVKVTGVITVTPQANFYEIKIPEVTLQQKTGNIRLGTVTLYAVPGNKGEYVTTMALPAVIGIYNSSNTVKQVAINIGQQKFTGTWLPAVQSFVKIDSEYKDIKATWLDGADMTAHINSLKPSMNLAKDLNGKWSGPASAIISGLSFDIKAKDGATTTITLEQSDARVSYQGLDLDKALSLREKAKEFYAKGNTPSADAFKKFSTDVIQNFSTLMEGQKNTFALSNLSINIQPSLTAPDKTPTNINLKKLSGGFDMAGLQADKGSAALNARMEGLSISNLDPLIKDMMPTDGSVNITGESLPMGALSKLFSDLMIEAINMPEGTDENQTRQKAANILMVIPSLLTNAGATLTAQDTFVKSNDLLSMMDGKLQAKSALKGIIPVTGTINFAFQGLDELITKLQANGTTNPEFAGYAQALGVLQLMGQPDKAANGKSLRKYKIDLTSDGKIQLNGADLGSVMGAVAPALGKGTSP